MMSTCADFPDQDPYVHLPSLRSTRVDEWTSGRYPMQVYTGTSGHLGILHDLEHYLYGASRSADSTRLPFSSSVITYIVLLHRGTIFLQTPPDSPDFMPSEMST